MIYLYFMDHQSFGHVWPFHSPGINNVSFLSLGFHEGETIQGNFIQQLNSEVWLCQCVTHVPVFAVWRSYIKQTAEHNDYVLHWENFCFFVWTFNICNKFRFCIMCKCMNILCTVLQPCVEKTPISINIISRLTATCNHSKLDKSFLLLWYWGFHFRGKDFKNWIKVNKISRLRQQF